MAAGIQQKKKKRERTGREALAYLAVDVVHVERNVVKLQRAAGELQVELIEVEVAEDQIPEPLLQQRLAEPLQQRVQAQP